MILPKLFCDDQNNINVIVETPCGSNIKYKYDPKGGFFKLHKFLPVGVSFPLDFGFLPHTKGGDGDPLDALLINDFPCITGCVVECRIIALIEAQQKEKGGEFVRNDRFVAVAKSSIRYAEIKKIEDVGEDYLNGILSFFKHYNAMQEREFKFLGVKNSKDAIKFIETDYTKLRAA